MAYVELITYRGGKISKVEDQVRISFSRKKNKKQEFYGHVLIIHIGKEIAKKIGIKLADKIVFLYDEENPRKWVIKKELDLQKASGFKVNGNLNLHSFSVHITWNLFTPEENELLLHEVKSWIDGDELYIDAKRLTPHE
jgi:hypothetical protein